MSGTVSWVALPLVGGAIAATYLLIGGGTAVTSSANLHLAKPALQTKASMTQAPFHSLQRLQYSTPATVPVSGALMSAIPTADSQTTAAAMHASQPGQGLLTPGLWFQGALAMLAAAWALARTRKQPPTSELTEIALCAAAGSSTTFVLGEDGVMKPVSTAPAEEVEATKARTSERLKESADGANLRRSKETLEVEQKIQCISNFAELQDQLRAKEQKPGHLFVLEVESDELCESGLTEEAEYHWKRTVQEIMGPCLNLKHTFQRTARNCSDVTFLSMVDDGSDEAKEVCQKLQVTKFPTLVFIRDARVVWRHEGVVEADADLVEGISYFGDMTDDGSRISDLVPDLHTIEQVRAFTHPKEDTTDIFRVVSVLTATGSQCIHVFPALSAVGKHMKGKAKFARLLGDESPDATKALLDLGVTHIPMMIIFDAKTGKEVVRHVTTSRGDFIGLFLQELEKAEQARA